jgi:sugar/nucleoside kinase (ribokinase family)/Tfp pilus assembly protein PilF
MPIGCYLMQSSLSSSHFFSTSKRLEQKALIKQLRHRHLHHHLHIKNNVLGVGSCGLDIIATLKRFPLPDEKTRSDMLVMEVGGNAANALTAVARLSLEKKEKAILFTKIGIDSIGSNILDILKKEGKSYDTSKLKRGGTSPSTYIIVVKDSSTDPTRTCIHTPSNEPLKNEEVSNEEINALFDKSNCISLVYFDGRLTNVALRIAQKAKSLNIPILCEAERCRGEDLDILLSLANFCVCSKTYPLERYPNDKNSFGTALIEMATSTLSNECSFLIATLGNRGSVGLLFTTEEEERKGGETIVVNDRELDEIICEMEQKMINNNINNTNNKIPQEALLSESIYSLNGKRRARVVFQPAIELKEEDIMDTTGCGDAFIGTIAKGISIGADFLTTMRLATYIAAEKTKHLGARQGLPFRDDVPNELLFPFESFTSRKDNNINNNINNNNNNNNNSRRAFIAMSILGAFCLPIASSTTTSTTARNVASASSSSVDMNQLSLLFNKAMNANTYEDAEDAWTKAIELAPENSACYSNRGTIRLQAGRWELAIEDLQKSIDIDERIGNRGADASVLNNLGNAKGAIGKWQDAMNDFLKASKDDSMREIALANYSLAAFEINQDELAVKTAQTILRKDPEFWDMRAALTAFHWGSGDLDKAEYEWQTLCTSGRGFGQKDSAEGVRSFGDVAYASKLLEQQLKQQLDIAAGINEGDAQFGNDTPCALYRTTDTVAGRWPPRVTAALDAYLRVKRTGQALDYDGKVKEYKFK